MIRKIKKTNLIPAENEKAWKKNEIAFVVQMDIEKKKRPTKYVPYNIKRPSKHF